MLTIERRAATTVSDTGASEPAIVRQRTQRALSLSAGAADASRIVHTEQRSFVTFDTASATAPVSVPMDAAANTASQTDTVNAGTPGTTAAQRTMPLVPDERPLWRLLHEHRLIDYDRQVAQLEHETPSWQPSPSLAAERTRQRQEADIAAALQSNDVAVLSQAIARMPEAFSCDYIDRVWQAADVFAHTGHLDDADALYRTVIPACASDANRIATLYRAEHQLSAERVDALIALEASQGHRDAQGDAAFARLRYERAITALSKLPPGSPQAASAVASVASAIRANRDGPAAALAGWIAHAQHDRKQAQDWFETALTFSADNVDAKLGLAQVRIEAHEYDAAQSLLDEPGLRDEARAREQRTQIALARANDAYAAHRYKETLKWLDAAAQEGLPATDTAALRGWAFYALGRFDEAAAAFRTTYEARHDDDSAEGLAMSTHAMREHGERLGTTRPTGDGRIDAYLDALDAQTLYYRKQFVASHAALRGALTGLADPQRIARYVPADLTGIDAPSAAGGLTWSDHIGAAGQGRLDTIGPELQAAWFHGTTQFSMQYRQLFINAGTTSLDQAVPKLIGTLEGRLAPTNSDIAQQQSSIERSLKQITTGGSARAEAFQATVADSTRIGMLPKLDWSLSLGGTQGAPAGFQYDAAGSVGQRTTWGMWTLYGGSAPVRDSLLSWRGTTLPESVGGGWWGAVRRTAGGVRLQWQPAPRWNISAAAEGQWLTGQNVVGNEGISADLSAGYDFRLHGFDYFSVGPTAHYLSYRRNENFYSWGQGGYYSPQSSLSTGVALQWLTQEGRGWQFRGNVEGGWNNSLQHTEQCFPLGLNPGLAREILSLPGQNANSVNEVAGLTCAGSHDHGPYASAAVAAVAKLSSRMQIGALATANVTPGRDKQFGAAVFVRYFFEPRAAVFSSDLPSNAP
jgi:tetratricopeptide (TPR) repeat protein